MKEKLSISLVQTGLQWESVEGNLNHIENLIRNTTEGADLVILPEMFSTGFSMNVKEVAENMQGKAVSWMKDKSREINAVITGSLIIEDNGSYYNRLIWSTPDELLFYDKRHLFRMQGEDKYYTPGKEKKIFHLHGWKICPMICYDIRFPVWSRNTEKYDLLLYVANWPAQRNHVWDILLHARAIENQSYVAGVNRIGRDGAGAEYLGNSYLIHPNGTDIVRGGMSEEDVILASVDYRELEKFRKEFPVGEDADKFELKI